MNKCANNFKTVAHVIEKLQVDGNQELKWVQNPTANIG